MAELTGGKKMLAALRQMSAKLDTASVVEVGFLEGATYPYEDGEDPLPVAQVAAWNEFGTKGVPTRPFFRSMIAAKSPEWGPALGKLITRDKYDAEKALGAAGQAIAGQLRESIINWRVPPNSAKTIQRKGFDDPLIDSGYMLSRVDSAVK